MAQTSEPTEKDLFPSSAELSSRSWYHEVSDPLTDVLIKDKPALQILVDYSKMAPEKVGEHVVAIRDKAWKIFPYPCVGFFQFLDLSISEASAYGEVLARVKGGEKLLDVGCCFGQDIRKLVADGAPSENLYGTDMRMEFMDAGYDLFLDRGTLASTFIAGDVFDEQSALQQQLRNQISIIHASYFFHLFSWADQLRVCVNLISLLKDAPGCLFIGRHLAHDEEPGEYKKSLQHISDRANVPTMYRHDDASWKRFWDEVGAKTGTKWDASSRFKDLPTVRPPLKSDAVKKLGFNKVQYFVVRSL